MKGGKKNKTKRVEIKRSEVNGFGIVFGLKRFSNLIFFVCFLKPVDMPQASNVSGQSRRSLTHIRRKANHIMSGWKILRWSSSLLVGTSSPQTEINYRVIDPRIRTCRSTPSHRILRALLQGLNSYECTQTASARYWKPLSLPAMVVRGLQLASSGINKVCDIEESGRASCCQV